MTEKIMDNQQPTNSTPEATGGQGEKLFTQEDVNRIVSERLARERAKVDTPPEDEREKAFREREQALTARENRAKGEDYLAAQNIHKDYRQNFIDVLDLMGGDVEKFKQVVAKIGEPYIVREIVTGAPVANPPENNPGVTDSMISAAFKP